MSIDILRHEIDLLNGCDVKTLVGRDLDKLSKEELFFLNKFISSGYSLSLSEIEEIEKEFLDNGYCLDEEVILLLVVSISGYYLDNNFHSKLDVFFSSLGLSIDEIVIKIEKLRDKYRNTDKFCYVSKNIKGFLHYYYLSKKEEFLSQDEVDEVEQLSIHRVEAAITELDELLDYKDDDYYFYYFNTLVSYANYDILFIGENNIKQKYFEAVQKHIDKFSIDYIQSFSTISQLVFLNNISFLKAELSCIEEYLSIVNDISKKNIDGLYSFTRFYSGLDISYNGYTFRHGSNDISLFGLCRLQKTNEDNRTYSKKISILTVLSETCPIKTIKKNADCLLKFLTKKTIPKFVENEPIIRKNTEKYKKDLYYSLYYDVSKSNGFNADYILNRIKNFIIQYLGLDVNVHNIGFTIYVSFDLNNSIDIPFVKNIDNYKNSGVLDLGYIASDSSKFIISIDLPDIDIDEYAYEELSSNEVAHFFELVFNRILELNNFLNQIDTKISNLEIKDIETVEHMRRIGDIIKLFLFSHSGDDYIGKISELRKQFPVKNSEFYNILGYLHDIGKSDRVEAINKHKNTNIRVEGYEVFSKLIISLLPKLNPSSVCIESDVKIRDIQDIIGRNGFFVGKVKELFDDISTFNLKNAVEPDYYISKIFKIAKELKGLVAEKIKSTGVDYKVFKDDYLSEIKKNLDGLYDIDIDIEEINIYFLTIILVLLELGKFQVKELTYPHIIHGLQFFQLNDRYSFLSFVLYHHDYPSQEDIIYYDGDKGLEKLNTILGIKNQYLDKKDSSNIDPKNKNFLMVLTTAADLIDAFLGQRSYQGESQFREEVMPYLSNNLLNEITNMLHSENFSDKSKQFDKAISILNRIFSENKDWQKMRQIFIKLKDVILSKYS